MWFLPSQLGKLCADVLKNYTFTLKTVNDKMIHCKAGVLCTQCLFWNRSKTPRKNVWHTFNRGENMHKNVRLPIAYHVIGHPDHCGHSILLRNENCPLSKKKTKKKRVLSVNFSWISLIEQNIWRCKDCHDIVNNYLCNWQKKTFSSIEPFWHKPEK